MCVSGIRGQFVSRRVVRSSCFIHFIEFKN